MRTDVRRLCDQRRPPARAGRDSKDGMIETRTITEIAARSPSPRASCVRHRQAATRLTSLPPGDGEAVRIHAYPRGGGRSPPIAQHARARAAGPGLPPSRGAPRGSVSSLERSRGPSSVHQSSAPSLGTSLLSVSSVPGSGLSVRRRV